MWFKQKLPTRVAIAYDVLCPTPEPSIKGLQPRDFPMQVVRAEEAATARMKLFMHAAQPTSWRDATGFHTR